MSYTSPTSHKPDIMRRVLGIISVGMFFYSGVWAQSGDPVIQRLYLVGDVGEIHYGHYPVCDWLKQHVDWDDTSNVLVYLGDNIYAHGMPPEGAPDIEGARKIMDYEVSVVGGKRARVFFLPGNHDWKQGRTGGWAQLKNEENYIQSLAMPNVEMLPKDGCPGPVAVPLGDKVVLVCMDSQWWLEDDNERPGEQSACNCKDQQSVINGLKDIVSLYPDRLIVLAMHHPLYTHSVRGGYFTLGNLKYKDLREQVEAIIRGHNNIVDAAGHEHSLQLLKHDSVYYVVSGAGSKHTRVKRGRYSLMARSGLGFATISVHASGRSEIEFFSVGSPDADKPFFAVTLPPLPARVDTPAIVRSFPDSVTAVGDSEFLAGRFHRFLLGANYRKEWAAPVRVKVFDMTGWTPLERGGGTETRSLRIADANGKQYVLRGVKKYVTDLALPTALYGDQLVRDIVADGVSASYPYACLSMPPLATALRVPHADPQLVYIPDDPRLGRFRADYGNLFAFLEEHEPGNGKKTYNMWDLEALLQEDNDNIINQPAALRARLLDMFVMDFDRHEDQWRWMAVDNGKGKTLSPVPRDRDQPFFINNGLITRIAASDWAIPGLQGFRPKARNIDGFNYAARNFDRNYLNELTEKDWREAAEAAMAVMTDSVIEAALKQQPPAVQGYSMRSIIEQLKERRKYFVSEVLRYYAFISRTVSIYGSDKREVFDVERRGSDTVIVNVYKLNKEGAQGKRFYSRTFLSGETGEIRLYGRGGDDRFHIHGAGGGRTIVRIIGGPGNDEFQNVTDAPAGKTRIYDLASEKNVFDGKGRERRFLSSDPAVNEVIRHGAIGNSSLGYHYNILAPLLSVSYNPDDGVFLGAGFRYTTQGFHKDPYKSIETLTAAHSLSTKAYDFKYNFEAIQAIGKLDLLVDADIKAPNNTVNFFGLGNETGYNKNEKDGIRYYRARYNSYDFDVLLRKRFGRVLAFSFGPAFEYFTLDSADNFDRYVNQKAINGLDPATLYLAKSYLGGRAAVILETRDDKILPSRGIFWATRFGSYGGLNEASQAYSQLNTDMAVYTSFNSRAGVVIANRVGWGKSFGHYDFYQGQFLGALEGLRGYHRYRFTGDEAFFHNLDVRIRLAKFNTYFFPGTVGLLVFNDVGRVWQHGLSSDQWHDGYGGGFWIAPLGKLVFSTSYGEGTDGGVFLFKLGFQY